MRDELLKCLAGVTEALVAEIRSNNYVYPYHDISLGERFACAICGKTSEFGPDQFAARHQDWCKIEKNKRLLLKAYSYLGMNG